MEGTRLNESQTRTKWELEKHTDKKAYQIRKQEERESKKALKDFERHMRDEEVDNEWGDD